MVLLMPYALIDLLLGLRQFLRIENPLKMMKNVFFILYFCSRDIYIFLLTFWLRPTNGLRRKLWLISNFMASQAGQQIITRHLLHNISGSKGNQTTEFG